MTGSKISENKTSTIRLSTADAICDIRSDNISTLGSNHHPINAALTASDQCIQRGDVSLRRYFNQYVWFFLNHHHSCFFVLKHWVQKLPCVTFCLSHYFPECHHLSFWICQELLWLKRVTKNTITKIVVLYKILYVFVFVIIDIFLLARPCHSDQMRVTVYCSEGSDCQWC